MALTVTNDPNARSQLQLIKIRAYLLRRIDA